MRIDFGEKTVTIFILIDDFITSTRVSYHNPTLHSAYTCSLLSNVESLFTYHIHDLHEGEAEVNGESLGVVTDWSHQRVVAVHQVLVQSALMWTLKRNYRRHRNMDSEYTFIITSEKTEQDRHC